MILNCQSLSGSSALERLFLLDWSEYPSSINASCRHVRPIIKPSVSKVSEIDRMDLHVQRIALIGSPAVVSDNISSNFSCNSL